LELPAPIQLELCVELQGQLDNITPDKYITPSFRVISGVKILGMATEPMKQMFTFWRMQEDRLESLILELKAARTNTDEVELKIITVLFGTTELLSRGVATALGYEIGRHFDAFGQRFGIDADWKVYVEDVAPLSYVK